MPNNFGGGTPPQRGAMPNFDAEEAKSHEASQLPHITPEATPQWNAAFTDLADFARRYQAGYEADVAELSPSSVHILGVEEMRRVATLLHLEEEDTGVYDPYSRLIYVQKPEIAEGEEVFADLYYGIAHELGHKLTHGLSGIYNPADSAFILIEGMADRFTGRFLRDVFLPTYAPRTNALIKRQFERTKVPYSFGDWPINRDEIVYIDPQTLYASGIGRLMEKKIVDALEAKLGGTAFSSVVRAATKKDVVGARQIIIDALGIEMWRLLTSAPDKAPDVLSALHA